MASKYALEATFNLIDKITKPLEKVEGQGKIVSNSLKTAFAKAQSAADKFGGALGKVGGALKSAIGTYASVNLNKVASFMTSGVQGAMELSDTFAKMSTSVDTSVYSMKELQKQITAIANAEGEDVNVMAKIQMDVIGTGGIDPAKSAEFAMVLKKVSDVAGTDTHTAMTDLTSVMGAFGMQAEEGAKLAGQMLLVTQKLGRNITFEQMAKGMKSVVPEAAALNISTGELFSSFATLTSMGEDSTKAMKGMGTMLTKIQKPSKAAAELAQNLGIEFNAAAIQSKGLAGFIADVTTKTGGNTELLTRLFEDVDLARIMRKLGVEGAAAFTDGISQMANGAVALQEFHDKSQDSIAERWEDAINRMKNTGVTLGAAFMPVLEKIVDKIGAVTAAFTSVDTSKLEAAMNSVANAVGWAIDSFISAVKFAWQFRGVIIAVSGAILFFTFVMKAIETGTRLYNIAMFASTLLTKEQTVALATLKGGTLAYLVVDKLFTIATAIRNAVLGILTRGTLAQTAATASMAVATGTATTAQWLLNAAMNANPIGLVIMIIAALIGVIIGMVKWWKAATEGVEGFGKKLQAFVLYPIQGLYGLLSKLPGKAGETFKKLNADIDNMLGRDIVKEVSVESELPTEDIDKIMSEYQIKAPEMPGFDVPDFNISGFDIPDMTAAGGGGKSPLHGVVDLSKGPSTITHLTSSVTPGGTAIPLSAPAPATATPAAVTTPVKPSSERLLESVLHIEALVGNIEAKPPAAVLPAPLVSVQPPVVQAGAPTFPAMPAPKAPVVNLPPAAVPPAPLIPASLLQSVLRIETFVASIAARPQAAPSLIAEAQPPASITVQSPLATPPAAVTVQAPPAPLAALPTAQLPPVAPQITATTSPAVAPPKAPVVNFPALPQTNATSANVGPLFAPVFSPLLPQAPALQFPAGLTASAQEISATVQRIDTAVVGIAAWEPTPVQIDIPGLAALVEAARTPVVQAPPTERYINTGAGDRDNPAPDNPRNIPPVSREERMVYSMQERRDTVGIEVSAAPGTSARVVRRPKAAAITLTNSGGRV
jgi:TP901 family phage tail tape measure protein